MSEHFDDARKGTMTADGLRKLAEIVANRLPEGSVVVAAVLMMRTDPEEYTIEFDDMIEYEDAVAGGGRPESIIAKLQERIEEAMVQYTDEEEEWSFDTEAYPVLVYRIESNLDYYCIVAIAAYMQGGDAEVDEPALLKEMAGYIKANAPAPALGDKGEAKPRIFYRFGKLTDSGRLYDDDYTGDDDEYIGDNDEEEPEGE